MAICLLLGGCSENKDSTPRALPATGTNAPPATAPISKPPKTEFERTAENANAGDAVGQSNLGVMYRKGEGVPQDDAEAVKWYRLAAEQEHAGAQTNPLNENVLAEFIELQKTKPDSGNSWTVDVKDIDESSFDLSVKNPTPGDGQS